jgi:predicted enzyme related to lactoylglutathione lyase
MMEPMDVMDAGRMVAAQDPSGAMVGFWQAKKHTGYTVVNEPGAAIWNELLTRDTKKATAFYKAVLGVNAAIMPMPGMDYTLLKVAGTDVAGIMAMPKEVPAQVPSHWGPYFAVANADATVKKALSLGGKAIMPAQDIPNIGRFATLSDPQGATFSILQPAQM